jgi:hypothetical protein
MRTASALTLLLSLLLGQQAGNLDNYIQVDGNPCPLEGTAKSVKGKQLDRLKDRYNTPTAQDVDDQVTLAAMVAPGEDSERFDEGRAATVVGFVRDVMPGGKGETCNCNSKNLIDMDTHVPIALTEDAPAIQQVIVEVTPRVRFLNKQKNVDWSTDALASSETGIKGKWVRFTGWLMFDTMHVNGAENTNPGDPKNWRATCWEIHPITAMTILDGPPKPGLLALGVKGERLGLSGRVVTEQPGGHGLPVFWTWVLAATVLGIVGSSAFLVEGGYRRFTSVPFPIH